LGELMVLMQSLSQKVFAPAIHRISKEQERACATLWLAMRDEDIP